MAHNPEFGRLLCKGIKQAALANGDQRLGTYIDTLAFEINCNPSAIFYWRKGNIPADPQTVAALAERLFAQKGLTADESKRLVVLAGHRSDVVNPGRRETISQPFIVGTPIFHPSDFFGRVFETRRIVSDWRGTTMMHHWIAGKRRSGKTSLLRFLQHMHTAADHALRQGHAENKLAEVSQIRFVHVDFHDGRMTNLPYLLGHLLEGFGFAENVQVGAQLTIETFMATLADYDWSRPVVLTADELDRGLNADTIPLAFWESLRSLATTQCNGRFAMVFASSDSHKLSIHGEDRSSPLDNIFNTFILKPFTDLEARELISTSPIVFDDRDIEWILLRSERWPCALQLLCKERLMALIEFDKSERWKEAAERGLAAYQHLLTRRP